MNIEHPVYLQMVEDVAGELRAHELHIGDAYLPSDLTTQHLRLLHIHVMQDIYAELRAIRGDELMVAQAALKDKPDAKLLLEYDTREGAHGQLITLVPAGKVNQRLEEIGERLRRENYLGGLDKPAFVARLVDYYLAYSKVAPFRLGSEQVGSVVLNKIGVEAGYIVAPNAAKHLREVTDVAGRQTAERQEPSCLI